MPDTDVDLSTLQRIAARLGKAGTAAQELPGPPSAPKAGACSAAVVGALSTYTDAFGDLVNGLASAANEVRSSHDSFADTEARNKQNLHNSEGH